MTCHLSRHFFLFALLFVCHAAFAQKMNYGFYAGPTLSTLRLEQRAASDLLIDPYDFKLGFTGGGFATFTFADNVGIRGELNFERKGGKSALQLSDGHGNPLPDAFIKEKFDYFQVPVLFQLSAGKDFKMFIHAGYAFSYLLHRTDDFPSQITVVSTPASGPPTSYVLLMPEDYKEFDHSLVAGIGASPLLENGMRVQFMLRAVNGKLNISKGASAFDARNLSVALLAGLEF